MNTRVLSEKRHSIYDLKCSSVKEKELDPDLFCILTFQQNAAFRCHLVSLSAGTAGTRLKLTHCQRQQSSARLPTGIYPLIRRKADETRAIHLQEVPQSGNIQLWDHRKQWDKCPRNNVMDSRDHNFQEIRIFNQKIIYQGILTSFVCIH